MAIAGCETTTEYVYVEPSCTPPPAPGLPIIEAGPLWEAVGQQTYDRLMERERLLVDWALELEAMLVELCGGEDDAENERVR